jgi:hypothetical protein
MGTLVDEAADLLFEGSGEQCGDGPVSEEKGNDAWSSEFVMGTHPALPTPALSH